MQTIIFLEGCDNTGKSSVGEELEKAIGIKYFKNTTEKTFFYDKEIAKYRWLDQLYLYQFLKKNRYSQIIDRGFASDFSYTRSFRKENEEYVTEKIIKIDKLFASIGTKIIYFFKDNNLLKDDIINVNEYGEIVKQYEIFLSLTKCEVFRLNTTDENLTKQIGEIKAWLKL
jgi:hypothetical protein